jgi:hypothetical protein
LICIASPLDEKNIPIIISIPNHHHVDGVRGGFVHGGNETPIGFALNRLGFKSESNSQSPLKWTEGAIAKFCKMGTIKRLKSLHRIDLMLECFDHPIDLPIVAEEVKPEENSDD